MTTKLARWSWVLALPISAVLAAPAERAVEVPLNSTSKTATKPMSTSTSGKAPTRQARKAAPVKERDLSMRDAAPAGPGDDGVSHSVHDWVPRTPAKASSHTQTQSAKPARAHRAHWWSRRHRAAGSQKAGASRTQAQSAGSGRPHRAHWWSRPHRAAASQKAEEVKH